jgi:predicted secreted protein
MRLVFPALLIATVGSALWACFLFLMLPLGSADFLFGSYREQLRQAVGTETASQLTEQASRVASEGTQQAVLLVGLPFVLTCTAWATFCFRLLKSHPRDQPALRQP